MCPGDRLCEWHSAAFPPHLDPLKHVCLQTHTHTHLCSISPNSASDLRSSSGAKRARSSREVPIVTRGFSEAWLANQGSGDFLSSVGHLVTWQSVGPNHASPSSLQDSWPGRWWGKERRLLRMGKESPNSVFDLGCKSSPHSTRHLGGTSLTPAVPPHWRQW